MAILFPSTLPAPYVITSGEGKSRGLVTPMDSRRSRHRRQWFDAVTTMDLRWIFTEDQYEEFATFYQTTLNHGADPMSVPIRKFNTSARKDVRFLEPSAISVRRSDNQFVISAQVLVVGDCEWEAEETWESYSISPAADCISDIRAGVAGLAGGCGWNRIDRDTLSPWTITIYTPYVEAIETWEDEVVTASAESADLDGGCGWSEATGEDAWTVTAYAYPIEIARETWEAEADTSNAESADLDGGTGWSAATGEDAWTVTTFDYPIEIATETWEAEATTSNAEGATLDGGTGWSAATGEDAWTVTTFDYPVEIATETWEAEATTSNAESATLDGGTGWSAATGEDEWDITVYPYPVEIATETWEAEATTSNAQLATLDGGTGWETDSAEDTWEITIY